MVQLTLTLIILDNALAPIVDNPLSESMLTQFTDAYMRHPG